MKLIKYALLLIISAFLITPFGVEAAQERGKVVIVEVNSEIKAGTAQFIKRTLSEAEKQEADLYLINLNTPGGLLKSTEEITRLLLDSRVKTAVFVDKAGGWAFSAGTFILISAEVAAAHPESSIGAAQPRLLGLAEVAEPDEKIVEASVSWIRSLAAARERNADVAEKFVRENLTLGGKEALNEGIVDFAPTSTEELLASLNINDSELIYLQPSLVESLLSFFSTPQIASLLLTIGGLGIILVFRTGEFETLGIIAISGLLLGLWGLGAISLSVLGVAFLVVGATLLFFEITNPGFGVFGVAGTVSILFGVLFFGQEPFSAPVLARTTTYLALGSALAFTLVFLFAGRLSFGALRSTAKSGMESYIGKVGVVLEELDPYGRIQLDYEDWRAKSIGKKINRRQKVKVVSFSGNTLIVKKAYK